MASMQSSEENTISQIRNTSGLGFLPDLSFFQPYLYHYVREVLEIGGEVFVAKSSDGIISGVFLYDESEKTGAVYTRSRNVFDRFYGLRSFNFLYAEMKTEHESEIYDIYTVNVQGLTLAHRFSHEISVAERNDSTDLEQFMAFTHLAINKKWVNVALSNGDKCFVVRLGKEIAGLGWLSIVNNVGRLHSLYVKPQYRGMGMGEDILHARLLWLKSKRASLAFSEISRNNSPSSRIAAKGHMEVSGQMFLYFKKNDSDKATDVKKS